jgi:hypothetical protein
MITTEVSAPVLKPTNDAVYKHRMNAHPPIKKHKLDKNSRILIWFEGLGYCCNTLRYISLDIAMYEMSFLRKVCQKFHLPREAADIKIALIFETTQDVEWTISSKQGDETGWPDYREGLFKKKDGRGICDGVYAVISCSAESVLDSSNWQFSRQYSGKVLIVPAKLRQLYRSRPFLPPELRQKPHRALRDSLPSIYSSLKANTRLH